MAEESFQERTEQATPKRREEARKKGQVARSRELSSVTVLLTGIFTLFWGSAYFYHHLAGILKYYLYEAGIHRVTMGNMQGMGVMAVRQLAVTLLPLFLALVVMSVLANYLQVGTLVSFEAIAPKFSKLNPLEGLKRLFSGQAIMEFAKSMFKLAVVGWIAWDTVSGELPNLLPLIHKTPGSILNYVGSVSFAMFWKVCLVMIMLAVLDFLFQRWEFEKSIRMTKQEVKEEHKQTEGDPMVKSRIRSIQREMAQKRMMAEVPEADVVITNPTRLAIALKYEAGKMDAPQVVAKGSGTIARRIREVARDNGVPVIENRPLAQSLFKMVEVGQAIPETLYKAVAQILAHVYSLRKKRGAAARTGGNG